MAAAGTMSFFAKQEAVLNRQAAVLRTAHSWAVNDVATAEAARRAIAYRSIGVNPHSAEGQRYARLTVMADNRIASGRRRRDNLERNMTSLNVARNRNTTARRAARQTNSRMIAGNMIRRSRYNRAARNFGRSPVGLVGRGIGGAASAAGNALGITALFKFVGSSVMRWIPTATKTWGSGIIAGIARALLPVGTIFLTALNPVGWAATIITGIAAVGNTLPTLMYKAYDGFMSMFSEENMSRLWEWFKDSAIIAFDKTVSWLGKGLYGIGLLAESVFWTAINALGNGLRRIIQGVTLGAVDIGEFNFKSTGYEMYEAQKRTDRMEAERTARIEEQNKIAKRIAEMRGQIVEQERKWLESETEMLRKRGELATGRFDSLAKEQSLAMKAPISEMLTRSVEAAIPAVQSQVAQIQEQFDIANTKEGKQRQTDFEKAQEEVDQAKEATERRKAQYEWGRDNGGMFTERYRQQYEQAEKEQKAAEERLAAAKQALDANGGSLDEIQAKWDSANARLTALMTDKEKYTIDAIEQRYALFDMKFENAGKVTGYHPQMGGYGALLSELQESPMLRQQAEIEAKVIGTHQELAKKRKELNEALAAGDDQRVAELKEEIQQAEKNAETAQFAYSELQANLSDQRKVRERMETLRKEQDKRYKEATDRLWTFNFDHASTATQQQMARSAFFKAQNQFEGARTDDERETALQEMQTMYGKMDQQVAEMPAWNGMLRTTAGAVESDSVAAQELQERVLNDFNRILVDNAQQQTVIQQAMKNAMEQMVKNTDPNNHTFVGGYS